MKLTATFFSLILVFMLAISNPSAEKYKEYIRDLAHQKIQSGNDDGMLMAWTVFGSIGDSVIDNIISASTTRKDYFLFSFYDTDVIGKHVKIVGILNNFILMNSVEPAETTTATKETIGPPPQDDKTHALKQFIIASGAMMPTLLVGDVVLVNMYAYGLHLSVLNKKIVNAGEPQRGDVVVFRYPKDPNVDYIKRLVALPGDKLAYYNKILYINGQPMPQQTRGEYTGVGQGVEMSGASLRVERLGTVEYQILVVPNLPEVQGEFTVPPGQYFAMGDNRDNSNDSRYWGPVPNENLVGKVYVVCRKQHSSDVMNDCHWIDQHFQ